MAKQITVDLITNNEREVASILVEFPNLFMEMLTQEGAESTDPRELKSPVLQNKTKEGPRSPVTPLCPPNSSSEEQLVAPPAKSVKKRKSSKKERLMEKKEEVMLLSKEKEDLTREFLELQEKCWSQKAMNFYLKDTRSKLKPVGIKMTTDKSSLNFKIKLARLPQLPLIPTAIGKPKREFNLNAVVASLTCDQFYREEKAAKAAQARKRRMEIMHGKRTSPARKRPRVQ